MMLTWKNAKQLVVLVIGGTILLIGAIGIVVPIMPGFIFIPIGLAVLATEFVWAKNLLAKVKQQAKGMTDKFSKTNPSDTSASPNSKDNAENASLIPSGSARDECGPRQ